MSEPRGPRAETYLNPVYPDSFPDPFVLKFAGEYFAYCTGHAEDGNVFPVLHSHDLVTWTRRGGAMTPLGNSAPYYWAPEVTYNSGKFYLYYSVGNETLMELRVAVSDRPDGRFIDTGKRLTSEDFAIDAHVFVDDDGTRYLFYATDFLDHTHVGTGTVVDRMIDWLTLEGDPRPVTRARYDWQVYDPNRKEKGGVRWHTVEGPVVLKRKGVYYEMFSGGNWQDTTYGVSFAVTRNIQQASEWLQFSDGENVLPILRTVPGSVVGPGHNSVVRGPNNRELYCVYHRWVGDHRVMSIDRMDFAGDRIFVVGATHTPQPAPFQPRVKERFRSSQLSPDLVANGTWRFGNDGAISDPLNRSEMALKTVSESFLMELSWRLVTPLTDYGEFGITLGTDGDGMNVVFDRKRNAVGLTQGDTKQTFALSDGFAWASHHIARIEVDCRHLRIRIDNEPANIDVVLDRSVTDLSIFADRQQVAISSLDLTEGFEDQFENKIELTDNGWDIDGFATHQIEEGELILDSETGCALKKGPALGDLEFAANFRTVEDAPAEGQFGLMLVHDDEVAFRLAVDCGQWGISVGNGKDLQIPNGIDFHQYHQLRIIKKSGRAICYLDDTTIGEFPVPQMNTDAAVFCRGVRVAIEMVRVTSI